MTVKEARRYLRKWKSAETALKRLQSEKARLEESLRTRYELDVPAPDGQPHGNRITHPTEDKALNIVELADEYRERLTECEQKIKRNVELLRWVDYALALADHEDILRAYYYDKKPMPVIATEMHISTATAWRYERIGVASICAI